MKIPSNLGILLIVFVLESQSVKIISTEKLLIKQILHRYHESSKLGRPVEKSEDNVTINFGLSLIQLLTLNEKEQVLSTNVWFRFSWKDHFLKWNPADYDNISLIRVYPHLIWKPDIILYNYADMRLEDKRDALATVYSDGKVLWIPQSILMSSCPIDITYFPFDTQKCQLKFGSWTYTGKDVDMEFFDEHDSFELTEYVESNTWDLVQSTAVKSIKTYPCCPDQFVDITFHVVMRRKGGFFNYILALPCVLLSMITLVIFWIPPESPSKMLLGINIYVAFFVLLLLLSESTPKAASSVPLLGSYFVFNMVLITLSTFLAAVVVTFNMRGEKVNPLPNKLKKVIFTLGKILGVENSCESADNPTAAKVAKVEGPKRNVRQRVLPNSLEADVRQICDSVNDILGKQKEKDSVNSMISEWRICALILDRLFFLIYLVTDIVAIVFIFSKMVG